MGKVFEFYGNSFYVYFRREHKCLFCNNKLSIVSKSEIVNSKSPEAKDFDFHIGVDGVRMFGTVQFTRHLCKCCHCENEVDFIALQSVDKIVKWEYRIVNKINRIVKKAYYLKTEIKKTSRTLEDKLND